ncbi:MAG: glycoside hydrolase family 95 protein [Treponema sp.]|nr:glycoside hydrolase family 95 protein [Treponema sp.]
MKNKLTFVVPPQKWEEFLPLGNGRLGAMHKVHPCNDVLQLNEEGIWSGGPIDRINPDTQKHINEIRKLVKEGKVLEAQELGFQTLSGTCFNERVYQTAGEFRIDFFEEKNSGIECGFPLEHKVEDVYLKTYKSELNLAKACTVVTYEDDKGVKYTRQTWISAPDDMLFMYVTASEKGKINFRGYLDRGIWVDDIYAEGGNIYLEDSHGIPFCVGAGVITEGGKSGTTGFCLTGKKCDSALFYIDIRAYKWDKKPLSQEKYKKIILKDTWTYECKKHLQLFKKSSKGKSLKDFASELFARHLKEYNGYYNRMYLNIGEVERRKTDIQNETQNETKGTETNVIGYTKGTEQNVSTTPTPELLKSVNKDSLELFHQYLNFSRYLLIAGSRAPGVLPTTLQGLWNCYMDPPWGSKYTININTEMNYWPVNMTGLSECEEPLFELLERAYDNGCITAKKMYGCKGYVIHHNTDYWGDCAPQDAWLPGTYWVLGGAWLSTHIYEHYKYTFDKACLEKYYYLMHEACRFFEDFLVPCDIKASDGKPYLVINPSVSPENSYVTKAGQTGAFSEGCEMDNMILEHLFSSCLKSYELLKDLAHDKYGKVYKEKEIEKFKYVLAHLKKPELNKDGSLMEWNTEVTEVEPGHRHISHLYGLFPGKTFTPETSKELTEAAKITLKKRLANGGGHTGWSQAWINNFRASLYEGNEALAGVEKILSQSTLPNLLDNHPPFQIDGNFGCLSAVMRMLVQSEMISSDEVDVRLLPALPDRMSWQKGTLRGVKICGDVSIDFDWEDGVPMDLIIHAGKNTPSELKVNVYFGGTDVQREKNNGLCTFHKQIIVTKS